MKILIFFIKEDIPQLLTVCFILISAHMQLIIPGIRSFDIQNYDPITLSYCFLNSEIINVNLENVHII